MSSLAQTPADGSDKFIFLAANVLGDWSPLAGVQIRLTCSLLNLVAVAEENWTGGLFEVEAGVSDTVVEGRRSTLSLCLLIFVFILVFTYFCSPIMAIIQ